MKISDFSVNNHQFTIVMLLMVVVLGTTTVMNMPKSEDPAINAPAFILVAVYPGASPEDMEDLVVDVVEEKFYELADIKTIQSTISDGLAVMQVEYVYDNDVDEKYQEVVRELNALREELPQNLALLEVNRIDPSTVKILQIGLVSENASRETLQKYADDLKERLEQVKALKEVEIFGLPDRIVKVELDLQKMAYLKIPVMAVVGSLQSEMANIPAGSIIAGKKTFNVKSTGNYTSLEEVANTIVYSVAGRSISLKEIANVFFDYETEEHITRLNAYRTVFVTAAQKDEANILKTKEAYQSILEGFKKTLPPNIAFIPHFEQADNVKGRLLGLGTDFLIAILLVLITLLPLGYRASAVVMITIPLSLSIGVVLLDAWGYSLNQLSIVGLVVALGLLVDDSIVVVENIERWLRNGYSKKNAAIKATHQISLAVIGFTATLIIAFFPLVMMPEAAGDFIRGLPLAVIFSVLASMLVSLTFAPLLSSFILKKHPEGYEGNFFLRAFERGLSGGYGRLVERSFKNPRFSLLISLAIIGAFMVFFGIIGFALFPASEKPQFLVNINAPIQTNIYQTDSIARDVEKVLGKIKEVEYYSTNVGKGNPKVYYNVIQANAQVDFGQFFVQLKEHTSNTRKLEIIEELRQIFANYVGAEIKVKNFEQGPPILAPVEVRIKGENLDTLRSLALRVEEMLEKTEGTIYIDNPVRRLKSNIRVNINKKKARALYLNLVDIDRSIRLAVAGFEIGSFTDNQNEEYEIVVSVPHKGQATMEVFEHLYINNAIGQSIPLKQIATLELEKAPLKIVHFDKIRTVSVSAFVDGAYLVSGVLNQVISQMEEFDFPEGYRYSMGGEVESKQESFAGFGTVILVTVFLFLAALILQFKTLKSTVIVLSVIPLGLVGAGFALWITGNPMSFVAIIGMIALIGIEIKNSILLVDFANQLRQEGKSVEEAILEAGEKRFVPIVLTALTAIGGLIPIAVSTNPLISPLAIVIIGGLISSTLLFRLVTSLVYKLLPPKV